MHVYHAYKPESDVANNVVGVLRTDDDSVDVFDAIAFVVGMNVVVDGAFLVTLIVAPKLHLFYFLVMVV